MSDTKIIIPGEFIEFNGQVWIPAAKHEQVVEKQFARIAALEAAGDVLLQLWYVYNATDVEQAAEAWRKARGQE